MVVAHAFPGSPLSQKDNNTPRNLKELISSLCGYERGCSTQIVLSKLRRVLLKNEDMEEEEVKSGLFHAS